MALLEEAQRIIMELEEEHEQITINWSELFKPGGIK